MTVAIRMLAMAVAFGAVVVQGLENPGSRDVRFEGTSTPSGLDGTSICESMIAYVSGDQWWFDIYLMTVEPPRPISWSDGINEENHAPDFSPDGQQIVFESSSTESGTQIFVMDIDRSNLMALTSSGDSTWNYDPAWSPDGKTIAFVSDRNGNPDIYVMNADGSNVVQLTDRPTFEGNPAWSPDGEQIAFDSGRSGHSEIYVMNADGSDVVRLTTTRYPTLNLYPVWSPDGETIVYFSDEGTDGRKYNIFAMNPSGGDIRKLTDDDFRNFQPAWSPDGQRIAFSSDRDGDFEIYVMNADGSNVVQLTHNTKVSDQQPAWRPTTCDGVR